MKVISHGPDTVPIQNLHLAKYGPDTLKFLLLPSQMIMPLDLIYENMGVSWLSFMLVDTQIHTSVIIFPNVIVSSNLLCLFFRLEINKLDFKYVVYLSK